MYVMDLRGFARHLDGMPDRLRKAGIKGLRAAALRSIPELVRRTREVAPASSNGMPGAVDTGAFVRRWRAQSTEFGADVFNDDPKAAVIEGGRRAGAKMPPVGGGAVHGPTGRVKRTAPRADRTPLMLWVQRKLLVRAGPARQVTNRKTGKVTLRRPGRAMLSDQALRSLTFLVARAIKRRGLKPRPIMTASDFQDWLKGIAHEEVAKEVEKAAAEGES